MTTNTLFEALGHLQQARLLLNAELETLDEGSCYPVEDALSMTVDAISQLHGELKDRQDTRYDWLGGAA